MKRMWMSVMMTAAMVVTSFSAKAEELNPKELNFGIISTESTAELKKFWMPFLNDMSKKLGMKVNPFFASDYAGVIEGMRFKKVHLAWYGNKSAMEAVDRASGEIFAQTVDVSGNPGYWSLIVTHKDSKLNSVDDIVANAKSLNFGNGDVNSTSGYLIPSYYLWGPRNIDTKKAFKTARNANHSANLMAVAMKQVDFATNNTESLRRLQDAKPELAKNIKILWKSPLIPSDPLVWRKDLSRDLKSKIKGFILAYGRHGSDKEKELAILSDLQWAPFWDSSNAQLLPIREIAFAKKRRKATSDEALSANERNSKVGKIDSEVAELKKYIQLREKY